MSTARQEFSLELMLKERRPSPRREMSLSVFYRSGSDDPVNGTLAHISLSGALLDSAALQVIPSIRPQRGTILKVELQVPGSSESIELTGSVVRHTRTGVAIQFLSLPHKLRQLLDQFGE